MVEDNFVGTETGGPVDHGRRSMILNFGEELEGRVLLDT